ncbi:MAG: glycosyl hydrolase family 18 protein, partial [Chitinophagaceae bacterium]
MKNLKNRPLWILIFIVAPMAFLTACNQRESSKSFKVIGYLYDKHVNIQKLPYQYLTDINYSFALPTPDSTGHIMPIPFPDTLADLVKTAHAHQVKVFVSIGGWDLGDGGGNDTRYEVLAASQNTRTTFVESAMALVRQFNLDGIDIDWEYPQTI